MLPEEGPIYITTTDIDRRMYSGPMAGDLVGYRATVNEPGSRKLYELQMETTKDLKVAGMATIEDAIEQTYKEHKQQSITELSKSQIVTYLHQVGNMPMAIVKQLIGDYESGKLDTNAYSWIKERVDNLVEDYSSTPISDLYYQTEWSLGMSKYMKEQVISKLEDRGYDAMYDNASIGLGTGSREGIAPMIVFDTKSLEVKAERALTNDSVKEDTEIYKQWKESTNKLVNK